MNTQTPNPNNSEATIDQRIRTMRTLWIALLLSVGMYYVFTILSGRPENVVANNTLFLVLVAIAVSTSFVSFLVKTKLLARATEQQQAGLVQQAYVVAWAMSEVPALLAMIDFFATANPYYYTLFILSACVMLLHFPRREHVLNASFKGSVF